MKRLIFFLALSAALFLWERSSGQQNYQPVDSTPVRQFEPFRKYRPDSALLAVQKKYTDSLIRTWLISDRLVKKDLLLDSLQKEYVFPSLDLQTWYHHYLYLKKKEDPYRPGNALPKGDLWVLGFIAALLILFAILKHSFSRQLQTIVMSFFSNRVLSNINKEDNLFTSWPFLLLFVQFGFTIGMFFYLVAQYYNLYLVAQGFKFFLSISILIIVLYALKIIILRAIGILFNIQKPVNEYVSILYLSYFNASLIFMPMVVAFALSPLKYGIYYIVLAFIILGLIFVFQFIRAGITILSHNRFSKMYLFLYFCALEICPILILIKTIGL